MAASSECQVVLRYITSTVEETLSPDETSNQDAVLTTFIENGFQQFRTGALSFDLTATYNLYTV